MKCPKCSGTVTTIKALNVDCNEVYRRKYCLVCGHIFYTAEFEVEPTKTFRKEWMKYNKKRRGK